ncbi:hypothetical protein F5Y16DRAFT_405088 [Xylariaceae sp. FL0255]|nr:hypothetical protein F5Y16DRAFT_405088 [Xylariaceae sp. FL0255]
MTSASKTGGLPSSPWNTRFPKKGASYPENGVLHSILAPEGPRCDDAKYYATPSSAPRGISREAEIDKICFHDLRQPNLLLGFRTWEAAALSRSMYFSPNTGYISGGHRPEDRGLEAETLKCFELDGIRVDETKWLPFLRKARWYDWMESNSSNPTVSTWSIDNPKIWPDLSISMELLETLLWGRIDNWGAVSAGFPAYEKGPGVKDDTKIIIPYRTELEIKSLQGKQSSQWDFSIIPTKTSDQWRKRLDDLLETLLWGFGDIGPRVNAMAVTAAGGLVSTDNLLITLDVDEMERIGNADLLPSERFTLILSLAVTIIHELAHAILDARLLVTEMGYFFEMSVFGGTYYLLPIERQSAAALGLTMRRVPGGIQTRYTDRVNDPFAPVGGVATIEHVPLMWISRMLSEDFWTNHSAYSKRKSDNRFHRNPVTTVSENPDKTNKFSNWLSPQLLPTPEQNKYPGDDLVRQEWEQYQQQMTLYRASLQGHNMKSWIDSPWSELHLRDLYSKYRSAFNKGDAIVCGSTAMTLADSVRWWQTLRVLESDLPSSSDRATGLHWPWHIIGLLMAAAEPYRADKAERSDPAPRGDLVKLKPSSSVSSTMPQSVILECSADRKSEKADQSAVYFHEGGPDDYATVYNPTPMDFLDLVDQRLDKIRNSGAAIHASWFDPLVRASQDIRKNRGDQRTAHGDDYRLLWADAFDLEIPEYDPTLSIYDTALGDWREVKSAP